MRKEDLLVLGLSLAVMAIPLFFFYAKQPLVHEIPVHWGLEGPDRFIAPKDFPLFVLALEGLIFVIWGIRFVYPLRQNVEKFARAYNGFVLSFSFLMALLLSASIQWAAGEEISIDSFVYIVVGTVLAVAGAVMYVSKRNWAVGFRNPWTLSSDRVWEIVNKEAGVYTTVIGALMAISGLYGAKNVILLLFALLIGYGILTAHSYVLWRGEKK